ncbi:SRPBCC domain-containing protein [Sphingomonas sp.]|uniref:SRPBCC family protein n=1 Tax=Sphingomonas sp. TaxID=28214 RepID=UPI001DD664EC|nr:SRPBCC domain-containing protein [Sphingomonas sp.]MBX9795417.1 SRPBCC domain-containing protein [Sphingomonas sp.]
MTTPRFTTIRHFAAPRARVWAAWTQPNQLVQWFGPKGSAGTILAFDLRPGGVWRGRMEAPDGGVMFSKFVFREVTPPARLVWIHGFADEAGNRARAPFAPQFPLELLTTVDFAEEGAGTLITLSWEPLGATAEEEAFFASMMASMEGGWAGSFEQLDSFLQVRTSR